MVALQILILHFVQILKVAPFLSPSTLFFSLCSHVLSISFPFPRSCSPYSFFFIHSVLVNNAAHIAWHSFFFSTIKICPGPVRHLLRSVDWSVSSQVSACQQFFIYVLTAEIPFISFLCCTIYDQTYCRTCQS